MSPLDEKRLLASMLRNSGTPDEQLEQYLHEQNVDITEAAPATPATPATPNISTSMVDQVVRSIKNQGLKKSVEESDLINNSTLQEQVNEISARVGSLSLNWGGGGTGIVRVFDADDVVKSSLANNSVLTYVDGSFVGTPAGPLSDTVRVYANGGLILANANLNFNNTATVSVSASANGTGQVNVAFTAIQGIQGIQGNLNPAGQNSVAVFASGTIVLANANLNFNNTATINVAASANGTGQSNVEFTVNTTAILSPAANTVAVYANGGLILANANVNFNNTASVNVAASANGTGQSNVEFTVNTASITLTGNLTQLNVTGNLILTSNVFGRPVVAVTANASYSDNAAGKMLVCNSASAITLTFAAASQGGFDIVVIRGNSGDVIIANTSGAAKLNTSAFGTANLANTYSMATVSYTRGDEFVLSGDIAIS